jgi:hypothetical protein
LLEGGWKHVGLETVGSLLKLRGEVMSENGVNTQEVEPEWGERHQILMTSFEPLSWLQDLSLDWSVMWANKFLFYLIQSVLGLGPLLVTSGILIYKLTMDHLPSLNYELPEVKDWLLTSQLTFSELCQSLAQSKNTKHIGIRQVTFRIFREKPTQSRK